MTLQQPVKIKIKNWTQLKQELRKETNPELSLTSKKISMNLYSLLEAVAMVAAIGSRL